MNNEIGRKITSLTLMTIMLAGGTIAFAPGAMPQAAAANANLFVSAENAQFQNYFSGPMVIEVVVIDSDIKDTAEAKGEPDVKVNGAKLRMLQATDGNWYAYFAEKTQAQRADQTVVGNTIGNGLDFGKFCSSASTFGGSALFTQTVGVAVARSATVSTGSNGTDGTATFINCNTAVGALSGNALQNNVVRENKTINQAFNNLGLSHQQRNLWPIIQLYDFTVGGNVVVQYNKGGGVQTTTLKFDTVGDFITEQVDRSVYPRGAAIHFTVTDVQLNIDPTDEDSWTFQTVSGNRTSHYQVFDENGARDGDAVAGGVIDITSSLSNLMFEDSGVLRLNVNAQSATNPVILIRINGDVAITGSTAAAAASVGSGTTGYLTAGTQPVTLVENSPNSGVFVTYDNNDVSQLAITSNAARGTSATLEYDTARTILVGFGFATISIDAPDGEWNSGEEIPITVTDSDANKNSRSDEDLVVSDPNVSLIPSLRIGTPFTLGQNGTGVTGSIRATTFTNTPGIDASPANSTFRINAGLTAHSVTVDRFSDRAILSGTNTAGVQGLVVNTGKTANDLQKVVFDTRSSATKRLHGFNFFNYDIRGISSDIGSSAVNVYLAYANATNNANLITTGTTAQTIRVASIANSTGPQGLVNLNDTRVVQAIYNMTSNHAVGTAFTFGAVTPSGSNMPIVADFFSFGYFNDGIQNTDRVNNAIYRIEVEETGDNTAVFAGKLEFIMVNQLNILQASTYSGLDPIDDSVKFFVHKDLDNEEAPRVNYNDLGADGVVTQVSAQEDAPAHSGVVSFNSPTFKVADTVTVTLEDQDLNTDVDLIDIYTVVNSTRDAADNTVGRAGLPTLGNGEALGRLLDITFDDRAWIDTNNACRVALQNAGVSDIGLLATGFTLIETGPATGVFTGDFQIPAKICRPASGSLSADTSPVNTQGLDMEVNYVDFRDASGQTIEVGDGAGIRANTGSVTLDRTVYPVPWGSLNDFDTPSDNSSPDGRSIFPVHLTGIGTAGLDSAAKTLGDGILTVHIQVNDPDFDISASGEDTIAQNVTGTQRGPVKIAISRGQSSVILGYAGGDTVKNGHIFVGANPAAGSQSAIRQFGPITETNPSSGIFELDLQIQYVDGPASQTCPTTATFDSLLAPGTRSTTVTDRFSAAPASGSNYCILQGDIITVEYTDPADASGNQNTVTDSATFDLRNGALQSDKSVYIIGSDMILTLIEPDFDLDNDEAETYDLDLIEWDSDAATVTIGNLGGNSAAFDPEPSDLRETGRSTGIFQSVIEIPGTLSNDNLERGEEIVLEYTDWGPSGADYVGQEEEDVNLTVFTSNFGATVELDQKVYTWTDKVYITIIAPDHNFDSNLVDEIGSTTGDPLKVSTRGNSLNRYKLVETGTDTGIFTGEVILTGFTAHDADGDGVTSDASGLTQPATGGGPTNGFLAASDDDGLTVSYEFSEDETVVGSALIRWNIGEVTFLEASYPASGTGVVRVIDPDMNLNPEAVDNFSVDVWSDSDSGGIDLTVTETNEATGIFEGTVFFTTTDSSSGHRLRVAEGDTVTAEYEDNTLPDPYTRADELDIRGTAFIGTIVPPLERAPAANARVVDAFGNTLNSVSVDQQVQITADLTNGQDREQPFAYLVQIQNEDGVTVSLAWITGSLSAGQSFSPALSWIPTEAGTYTATVFVWESVDNPTALSPPVSVDIPVS